jgi:uncharacterized OB-fold protein
MREPPRPDEEFRRHLADGRFMIQRTKGSRRPVFYPRVAEPGTGDDLEWFEPSGLGTIYSVTVVRKKPPEPSYNVVLVDLEEGPRMMSRVEGLGDTAPTIGAKVKARIATDDEGDRLIVFDLVAEPGR